MTEAEEMNGDKEMLKIWKEEIGFTESKKKPCLHLLAGITCPYGRASDNEWVVLKGYSCLPRCADHTSVWNKDGKMSALVTQPYDIGTDDITEIYKLCRELALDVEISNKWNWHYPDRGGVMSVVFTKSYE